MADNGAILFYGHTIPLMCDKFAQTEFRAQPQSFAQTRPSARYDASGQYRVLGVWQFPELSSWAMRENNPMIDLVAMTAREKHFFHRFHRDNYMAPV